jgi:hypothetical protein
MVILCARIRQATAARRVYSCEIDCPPIDPTPSLSELAIRSRALAGFGDRVDCGHGRWDDDRTSAGPVALALHPEGHDDQSDGTQTGDEDGHDARYRVRHGSNFCP